MKFERLERFPLCDSRERAAIEATSAQCSHWVKFCAAAGHGVRQYRHDTEGAGRREVREAPPAAVSTVVRLLPVYRSSMPNASSITSGLGSKKAAAAECPAARSRAAAEWSPRASTAVV